MRFSAEYDAEQRELVIYEVLEGGERLLFTRFPLEKMSETMTLNEASMAVGDSFLFRLPEVVDLFTKE